MIKEMNAKLLHNYPCLFAVTFTECNRKQIAGSYSAPWQKATSLKQIYNNVNSDKCDLVTPQMKRDVHTKSN